MASKIEYVPNENADREYPDSFIIQDAMFKVNGVYVCMEPCGGGGQHLLGDQYIYVSSTGSDDSEEGLEGDPFLTIAGAIGHINTFVTIGGDIFIVFLDEGPFYIDETVIINHQNKITFSGYEPGIDVYAVDEVVFYDGQESPPITGDLWWGDIAVWIGGDATSGYGPIQSLNVSSETQTTLFGTLTFDSEGSSSCSDTVKGLAIGSSNTVHITTTDEFQFDTSGNSTYFGDLITGRAYTAAVSNGTDGLIAAGEGETSILDTVEKWAMSSMAGIANFGTLGISIDYCGGCNDETMGLWGAGSSSPEDLVYRVFFASNTTGVFFGNLTVERSFGHATGNGIIGIFPGGYGDDSLSVIDYFTFSSATNATDWGDALVNICDSGGATSDGTTAFLGGNYSAGDDVIQSFLMVAGSSTTNFGNLLEGVQLLTATSGG